MTAILERRKQRLEVRKAARRSVSAGLSAWLDSDEATTIGGLSDAFGEKILAVACLVLMAPSALPVPSGGATHVFDVIALLFALQMVIARRKLWLPDRWRDKELGRRSQRALRGVVRFVAWCENISRRRLGSVMRSRPAEVVLGLVITVFVVGAFVSPPFSGLDTLPSLGVVLVALAILLEDAAFAVVGILVGVGGVGLTVTLGMHASHALFG